MSRMTLGLRGLLLIGLVVVGANAAWAGWDEGVAAFQRGDFRLAVRQLEATLRDQPNDARAHYLLGLTYAHQGRKRPALEQLQLALDPASLGLDPALSAQLRQDQNIVRQTRAAELAERAGDLGGGLRETLDRPAIERPGRPR